MNFRRHIARWVARRIAGHLAGRALSCAVYGDCERGHQIAAGVVARSGDLGVRALAGTWCEAIVADVPRRARRSGRFRLIFADGPIDMDADQVPPPMRWAGALVTAHAALDWPMCRDLLAAVPDDQLQAHLAELLHMAAAAVVARSEGAAL